MKIIKVYFIILIVIYTCILAVLSFKSGKMTKTLLLSVFSGLAVFTLVNILSSFTGVDIAVNGWTLGSSAVFGIPGVLGLLVLRLFF